MRRHIPTSALLTCAALSCGPKTADTDASASDSGSETSTGSSTPTDPTDGSTGDPAPDDPCALVPEPGSCEGAFERYFFDPTTRQCQVFTWGGCDGVVPFTDFVDCQNNCDPCADYFALDEPPTLAAPIDVTIRNDGQAPIFLRTFTNDGTAFRSELFELWTGDGQGPLSTNPNACDFACGTETYDECSLYCSDAGPPPNPRMIIPGGALKTQWGGQYMGQVHVPARCLPKQCDALDCGRWLDAAPGEYEIRVEAAGSWECAVPDCCEPNADGWCDVEGDPYYAYPDPYTLELAAPFSFPGGTVELAFQ